MKHRNRRFPAGDRQQGLAARRDRRAQAVGELRSQTARVIGRVDRVVFPRFARRVIGHQASSTQAELSRAISADEAAGPQEPAV